MTDRAARPPADEARARSASLYREVFAVNASGRAVLTLLEKRFAKAPDLSGTADAMLLSYVRSAQREVLDWIHTQIQIAERDNPPNTPEALTGEA